MLQTDPRNALHYAFLVCTQLDALCDLLTTDDRRQFIIVSVQLTTLACSCEFFKSIVWDKVSEESTFIFGDSRILFQHNVG